MFFFNLLSFLAILISNSLFPYIVAFHLLSYLGPSFLLKSKSFKSISDSGGKSKKNKEPDASGSKTRYVNSGAANLFTSAMRGGPEKGKEGKWTYAIKNAGVV